MFLDSHRFLSWLIITVLALCRGGYCQSTPQQTARVAKIDSVSFQFRHPIIPKRCSFQRMMWKGEPRIAGINSVTNELNFFPLMGGSKLSQLSFSVEKEGKIRSIQLWRQDSLLVYGRKDHPAQELCMLGPDGGRRQLKYDQFLQLTEPLATMESLDLQSFQDMHIHEEWLYIRILPYRKLSETEGIPRHYVIRLHLVNGSIERLPLFHPKIYYAKDYRFLFDLTQLELSDQKLCLSYMGHPRVYQFDLRNGQIDTLHTLSNSLTLVEPPLNNPDRYDLQEIALSGAYGKIVWDPYQQLWFRLIYPPAVEHAAQAANLSREDLPSVLLVYNKDWKLLSEQRLKPGYYDRTMFVSEKGLYIQNLRKTDLERNSLGFDLFKVKP